MESNGDWRILVNQIGIEKQSQIIQIQDFIEQIEKFILDVRESLQNLLTDKKILNEFLIKSNEYKDGIGKVLEICRRDYYYHINSKESIKKNISSHIQDPVSAISIISAQSLLFDIIDTVIYNFDNILRTGCDIVLQLSNLESAISDRMAQLRREGIGRVK